MVPGLFAEHSSFNEFKTMLLGHYHILSYDPRGLGKSEKAKDNSYTLNDHVNDLEALLQKHEIKKCHFFGLSNGGRVALTFAISNPGKVISVSVSDTYFTVSELLKLKLNSWYEAQKNGGGLLRFDVATPWIWGETLVQKRPELVQYYRERANTIDGDVALGLIEGAMSGEISPSEIKFPLQILVGNEDLLTPASYHEKFYQQLQRQDCEYALLSGGHGAPLEYPFQFAKRVHAFIQKFYGN
ncbi:alpha/beta hydrolase family protein [Bacteriovorax sp. BSW11_IV]|uniref:alpha/beta fold hydrolase n=1 Tax=Bacteriovorax sp. BSW11_IV TaxID=1353529 RepID=UPI00038A3CA2|nr:alpha/beta hydrolase [Bacteriovorax sp. BSW11_IV]EQC49419.1 alpha/beta hydrolase family protein [Bacteriovorax sp. BSW11_IV]